MLMKDTADAIGSAKEQPGSPLSGTGWLFLFASAPTGDSALSSQELHTHLFSMGLAGSALGAPSADDGAPIPLRLADTSLLLITGAAARAALRSATQTAVHAVGTPVPVIADGSMVLALRLANEGAARAAGLRRLCAAAALLIPLIGASHIYWQPARLWSPATELARAIIAMEASGLPPVLHLVAFGQMQWRNVRMQSFGLSWIVGQELRIDAPRGYDAAALLRVAARLAIDAMLHGGLRGPMDVPGLQPGELLHISATQREEAPSDGDAPQPGGTVDIVPVRIVLS